MRQIKIIDRSQDERFMREALALASEGAMLAATSAAVTPAG